MATPAIISSNTILPTGIIDSTSNLSVYSSLHQIAQAQASIQNLAHKYNRKLFSPLFNNLGTKM
jgi:hypothetical protein